MRVGGAIGLVVLPLRRTDCTDSHWPQIGCDLTSTSVGSCPLRDAAKSLALEGRFSDALGGTEAGSAQELEILAVGPQSLVGVSAA